MWPCILDTTETWGQYKEGSSCRLYLCIYMLVKVYSKHVLTTYLKRENQKLKKKILRSSAYSESLGSEIYLAHLLGLVVKFISTCTCVLRL